MVINIIFDGKHGLPVCALHGTESSDPAHIHNLEVRFVNIDESSGEPCKVDDLEVYDFMHYNNLEAIISKGKEIIG